MSASRENLRRRRRRARRQRRFDEVQYAKNCVIAWQTWRRWLREGAQCDCLTLDEFEAML